MSKRDDVVVAPDISVLFGCFMGKKQFLLNTEESWKPWSLSPFPVFPLSLFLFRRSAVPPCFPDNVPSSPPQGKNRFPLYPVTTS
jgi:hypothetical protein